MPITLTATWMGNPLPCPFCGMPPVQRSKYLENDGDGHRCFITECINQGCHVNPRTVAYGPHGYGPEGTDCETNDRAIMVMVENWNKRVPAVKSTGESITELDMFAAWILQQAAKDDATLQTVQMARYATLALAQYRTDPPRTKETIES